MIIWSGYGFVVAIITFVDLLLAEFISESIMHDHKFYQNNQIPIGCALIISGFIINYLDKYFTQKREKKEGTRIFDKVTIAQKNHSLFFIPFKYWSYILWISGIACLIYQLAK